MQEQYTEVKTATTFPSFMEQIYARIRPPLFDMYILSSGSREEWELMFRQYERFPVTYAIDGIGGVGKTALVRSVGYIPWGPSGLSDLCGISDSWFQFEAVSEPLDFYVIRDKRILVAGRSEKGDRQIGQVQFLDIDEAILSPCPWSLYKGKRETSLAHLVRTGLLSEKQKRNLVMRARETFELVRRKLRFEEMSVVEIRDRCVLSTLVLQLLWDNDTQIVDQEGLSYIRSFYDGRRPTTIPPFDRCFVLLPRDEHDLGLLIDRAREQAAKYSGGGDFYDREELVARTVSRYQAVVDCPDLHFFVRRRPYLLYPELKSGEDKVSFHTLGVLTLLQRDHYSLLPIMTDVKVGDSQLGEIHLTPFDLYYFAGRGGERVHELFEYIGKRVHEEFRLLEMADKPGGEIIFPPSLDFGDFKFGLSCGSTFKLGREFIPHLYLWIPTYDLY